MSNGMTVFSVPLIVMTLCVSVTSCAKKTTITHEQSGGTEQFGDRYMSNVQYAEDSNGNWVPVQGADQRSSFENKKFSASNAYNKSEYYTKDFRSKRWSGSDKNYKAKSYAGNEQLYHQPYFVKQAQSQGEAAYLGDENYQTKSYQGNTESVIEDVDIEKTIDVEVEEQGSRAPKIIENRQVGGYSDLDVEDTKNLLGR